MADGAAPLTFVDLSASPRLGFKGRGTLAAMAARGIVLENHPNRAFRQPDGGLCLVLGSGEILLLGALEDKGAKFSQWEAAWRIEDEERTYPLPRRDSHAWLAILGAAAPDVFAKLCGVDFRLKSFRDLEVSQTSIAKVNAIVARADARHGPIFHLLFDCASAAYMLSCLMDAGEEFEVRMADLEALRALEDRGRE